MDLLEASNFFMAHCKHGQLQLQPVNRLLNEIQFKVTLLILRRLQDAGRGKYADVCRWFLRMKQRIVEIRKRCRLATAYGSQKVTVRIQNLPRIRLVC